MIRCLLSITNTFTHSHSQPLRRTSVGNKETFEGVITRKTRLRQVRQQEAYLSYS